MASWHVSHNLFCNFMNWYNYVHTITQYHASCALMGLGFSPLRQAWNFPLWVACPNSKMCVPTSDVNYTDELHSIMNVKQAPAIAPLCLLCSKTPVVKGTTTRWWAKTVDAVQSIVKYSSIIQKLLRKTSQGIKDVEVYFKTCWGEFSNYILLSRCPTTTCDRHKLRRHI